MNDETMTLAGLKSELRAFRDERDWTQFHDPKNLAECIAIEAGELMELFLWKTKEEIVAEIAEDSEFAQKVREEYADIVMSCMSFANATGIDVSSTVLGKLEKARAKYPIEKAKGTAKKYTEL